MNYFGGCDYYYDLYLDQCPYEFSASIASPDFSWEIESSGKRDSKQKEKSEDEAKRTGAMYGV